jgi:hypothetical protein
MHEDAPGDDAHANAGTSVSAASRSAERSKRHRGHCRNAQRGTLGAEPVDEDDACADDRSGGRDAQLPNRERLEPDVPEVRDRREEDSARRHL